MKRLHKIEVDRLKNKFQYNYQKDIDYSTIVTDQDIFIIKLCLYYCVMFFKYNIIFYHPSSEIDQLNCYTYSDPGIGSGLIVGSALIYKYPYGYLFETCLIKFNEEIT